MYFVQSFFQKSILICLIAWACAAIAEFTADDAPYNYYSRNPFILRPWFAQFESWYPHNAAFLINISTGICNQTLRDYRIAFAAPRNSANATKLLSICYRHEACIVDQLQTNHMLNYQSSLVVLGLLPTLMVLIGPSVAEISLLYLHRPILSALLSLGTPTIWAASYLFEANTPDRARITTFDGLAPRRLSPRVAVALSASEYLLAAGAAVNSIFTALEIGRKTVLAWGCTTQFTPFLWAVLPSVVYAVAGAKNYYFVVAKETTEAANISCRNDSSRIQHSLKRLFNVTRRRLSKDTTLCAKRRKIRLKSKAKVHIIACMLDIAIGVAAFMHFAFGLAAFSALQFVTVRDAFGRILCRFALSTLICRSILVFELVGLGSRGVEFDQTLSNSISKPSRHFHGRSLSA